MAVLYKSVHFELLILLLRAKVNDQISWACCHVCIGPQNGYPVKKGHHSADRKFSKGT